MEPTSKHRSSCLQVFAIPELASMICSHAPNRDLVSLARVCRQLLHDICPILWNDVYGNGVYTLVHLFRRDDILPSMGETSPSDMPCFSFYAPLIKCLDVPVDAPQELKGFENWNDFLECARSTSLLPNLEIVRITRPEELMGQPSSPDVVSWITAFLSPSLTDISFLPGKLTAGDNNDLYYQCIELEQAHELLLEISERCPLLEVLAIFPSGIPSRTALEPLFPLNSRFNHLRELTTNGFVLDARTLLTLARFPCLELLTIHGHSQDNAIYGMDLVFPDNAFPALRFLDIRNLSLGTLLNLLKLPALCRNLETLRIQLLYYRRTGRAHSANVYHHIISSLANHKPPMRTLSLRGFPGQRISSRMISALEQFPLSSLQLWELVYSNSRLKRLFGVLPTVQELNVSATSAFSPKDLRLIMTSLPKLRLLTLNLRSPGGHEYDLASPPISSTGDFLLESNFYLEPRTKESAEAVARFLYALNPNVKYRSIGRLRPLAEAIRPCDESEDVHLINQALAELRIGTRGLAI